MTGRTAAVRLIAGLGNPGARYARTRHNIGAELLEQLAGRHKIELKAESRFAALMGHGLAAGRELRLIFPQTFMNDSGRAVAAAARFFKIAPGELLVLHDDLDLRAGQLKLKFGGGLAGHNGLKSVSACLGTQDYYRLRVGIGKPPGGDTVSWVLGRPGEADAALIAAACRQALEALEILLAGDLEAATAGCNGFKPL